jgi:DNA-binding transcriptional ArsR family regulator
VSADSDIDAVFKALAHPRRRLILDQLKDRPQTTGSLCVQHLKVLEDADLVIVRREGRERWNYLNALPIKAIQDRWIGDYAAHAVRLLDRLQADLKD